MNKPYPIRTIIPGFKVHPKFYGKTLIAVPSTAFKEIAGHPTGMRTVEYTRTGEQMTVVWEERLHTSEDFPCQYNPGDFYNLGYYHWQPDPVEQERMFE